jgi:hypothetical protein
MFERNETVTKAPSEQCREERQVVALRLQRRRAASVGSDQARVVRWVGVVREFALASRLD